MNSASESWRVTASTGSHEGFAASCPDSETGEYHYGHRQHYREPNVAFAEPRRHGGESDGPAG
jgi:hypothetical protein